MGSFDVECGISGLVVRPGDATRLVFVTETADGWVPCAPAVTGEYDSYGRVLRSGRGYETTATVDALLAAMNDVAHRESPEVEGPPEYPWFALDELVDAAAETVFNPGIGVRIGDARLAYAVFEPGVFDAAARAVEAASDPRFAHVRRAALALLSLAELASRALGAPRAPTTGIVQRIERAGGAAAESLREDLIVLAQVAAWIGAFGAWRPVEAGGQSGRDERLARFDAARAGLASHAEIVDEVARLEEDFLAEWRYECEPLLREIANPLFGRAAWPPARTTDPLRIIDAAALRAALEALGRTIRVVEGACAVPDGERSERDCEASPSVCEACWRGPERAGAEIGLDAARAVAAAAQRLAPPAFERLVRLLEAEVSPDEDAVLAARPGEVALYEGVPDDVLRFGPELPPDADQIVVDGEYGPERHFVARSRPRRVVDGARVESGDELVGGRRNLHTELALFDAHVAEAHLAADVRAALGELDLEDRRLARLVAPLFGFVRVVEAGDGAELAQGAVVPRAVFIHANQQVLAEGASPAIGEPVFVGLSEALALLGSSSGGG